jgi:hypothetical protein
MLTGPSKHAGHDIEIRLKEVIFATDLQKLRLEQPDLFFKFGNVGAVRGTGRSNPQPTRRIMLSLD